MDIDGEARAAPIESRDPVDRKNPGATPSRPANRRGIVLSSLFGLLVLAGAVYYFAHREAGTQVAAPSGSEQPADTRTAATTSRAPDSAEKPASPLTPSQEAAPAQAEAGQQTVPQPPIAPTPSPAAAPTPAPASPPVEAERDLATNPQPAESVPPVDTASAAPSTGPAADSEAAPITPPPMSDQPAALPDQQAAAPKKDNILVVTRGPAKIRSAPGKSGRVIGAAPRDAMVKELDRSGNWVRVETKAATGWINGGLLRQQPAEAR